MKIIWFVNSGPDVSHLWDVKSFSRLRDAKAYIKNLPQAPIGGHRPYTLERAEYSFSAVYGDIVKFKLIRL